ncbi:MAG: hypothetical protein HYU67_06635 [Flavobacteriia bacterium]|nr:hypothetical protein [Flavobacteriia bacterium]
MRFFTLFIVFLFVSCSKDEMKIGDTANIDCTDTISFQNEIYPLIQNSCFSCHEDGSIAPKISDYGNISSNASTILSSFSGEGIQKMPPPPNEAVNDSLIKKFSCWIEQGKLNN